ncbi:MAG: carbohydrate ABC transporter permease [Clostridia bacterium]|nr:carbohydrate ABC transporter permease [Clostridia bacterium]
MQAVQKKKPGTSTASRIGLSIFTILFVLMIVAPFVWLLLAAFKSGKELYTMPVQILPSSFNLQNFQDAFTVQPLMQYIINSIVVAVGGTLIIIIISCLVSFSLARTQIKGKRLVLLMLLSISLLPPVTILNPIYLMMSNLKMMNTTYGLALVLVAIELPTAAWYMMSFFQTIPDALEESAMIDGASVVTIFVRILMPLVAPGVFTVSIMTFIAVWNNYLFASVLNPSKKARTVTVALTMYAGETTTPWNTIAAAAIVACVPLVIMVLICQKRIVSGMVDGAVKG